MGARPLGFPLAQRLKSRTLIGRAFEGGDVVKSFPFITRCVRIPLPQAVPTQLMVSVPKRAFKRAVDRNRIKRLVREAWRLERTAFETEVAGRGEQWAIVLIFVGKEMPDWPLCQTAMRKLIRRLSAHTAARASDDKPEEHA